MKTKIKKIFAKQAEKHNKQIAVFLVYNFLIGLGVTTLGLVIIFNAYYKTIEGYFLNGNTAYASVEYKAEIELPMKQWVLKEIENAGLDRWEADRIVDKESKWKPWNRYINKDGTIDRGLWMINSYWHSEISDECAYDYKCATEAAIKIRLQDKNWHQWVAAKQLGIN